MKVLLLSHLIPGDAGPGAARVGWLARDLAPYGIETHLLAMRKEGTRRSEGAVDPPPGAVTVVPSRCEERPRRLASLLRRDGGLRRALVRHPSQLEAVERGLEAAARFRPDAILSTAPPRRVHEVAHELALRTGLPWVMDWQDPIALHPMNVWPSKSYYEAYAELERAWVRRAALHVVSAPSCEHLMAGHHPRARVDVVTNGWQPGAPGARGAEKATRGTLLYAGSLVPDIYGFARKFPWKLSMRLRSAVSLGRWCHAPFKGEISYRPWGRRALEAIARCREAVEALEFRGARDGRVALSCARRLGLGAKLKVLPWSAPGVASADLARAHVLWLCRCGTGPATGEPVVMAKVAYYLASGRPIFAVLPPECDTAAMLRGQPGVFMPDPNDERALEDSLREALSTPPERRFERDVEHLRWDRLAERLARILRVQRRRLRRVSEALGCKGAGRGA